MNKAHQIKLNPTKAQETFFRKSCGVARFTYNWALNKWQEDYKNGIKQSAYSLVKEINSIKKEQFPWMLEVGKTCCQYPCHNVEKAYKKMWKEKTGYPKFKKKSCKDSFVTVESHHQFKEQKGDKFWIPRLGWVKCHEDLRFEGKVNYVAVKRVADMWFAVVNIETNETPTTCENQTVVGVDLGIKTLATLSDGTIFENPKALRKNLKSLKRLQRSLSRKQKGSANKKKAQMKLARKHYKVCCIRKNALHQATSFITNTYGTIVLEDLNVKGMLKNRKLSQATSDVGLYEFRVQLEYKAKWKGVDVQFVDRFYPSSKTCSNCGNIKKELKLSERVYNCEACGHSQDRDLNAANNLASMALPKNIRDVKPVENLVPSSNTSRSSKKQELSNLITN